MTKFKAGDIVVAVRDVGSFGELVEGQTYLVKNVHDNLVEIGEYTYYDHRFELAKEKQMKLKDIIKPFMRVKTRGEGIWIAVEKDGEVFLVNGYGYNTVEEVGEYGYHHDGHDIMEVFNSPYYVCDYLNFDKFGESVWKLPPEVKPKSAQQIAVEELEASIKESQEKLESLKRSL